MTSTIYYLVYLLYRLISLYQIILVIYAFLSWVPPINDSIVGRFIRRIVDPFLSIFDGIPHQFGIFDFKVIIGLICLQVVQRFLFIVF